MKLIFIDVSNVSVSQESTHIDSLGETGLLLLKLLSALKKISQLDESLNISYHAKNVGHPALIFLNITWIKMY